MSTLSSDRLYELLPALHRLEDAAQGRPLQVLLRAITEQAEILRQNVDRLWDDFFIETCQDWVVPYLGDLVANDALDDTGPRRRVDVARTVYYRRRKGTLPMLEELARDVTGWGAHAVEMFELLGWTQNDDHVRPRAAWAEIRDIDVMDRVDGPFDQVSHTVDVRPPTTVEGWHGIRTIALFLYRLRSYPLQGTVLTGGGGTEHAVRPQPRPAGAPNRFHFSSLGAPAPLFTRWRREGDEAGLATEPFVPGPVRPIAFLRDLEAAAAGHPALYYGAAGLAGAVLDECDTSAAGVPSGGSLAVFADGLEVPIDRIRCKDLSTWDEPSAGSDAVFVDVARGRLTFAPDAVPDEVAVEYHYGLAGDLGGGPYPRRRTDPADGWYRGWGPDTVADPEALGGLLTVAAATADHTRIADALAEWQGGVTPLVPMVVHVEDDRTYVEDLTIDVTHASRVVLQAADERRPTLVGTLTITGANPEASVVLSGFALEGHVVVAAGADLRELRILDTTLVPGRALDENGEPPVPAMPSLEVADTATSIEVVLDRCITGPLRLPHQGRGLRASRSVLDGLDRAAVARTATDDDAAGPLELWQVTVFGEVHARSLGMASETIFTAPARIERTQEGCVRFSYVEPGSATPRRYRCQPDLALGAPGLTPQQAARIEAAMKPSFTSVHFHDPGYAQLGHACPAGIAGGGEDGSEMGVWAWLRNPQRMGNLGRRLDEYLPFGLDRGLIFVT